MVQANNLQKITQYLNHPELAKLIMRLTFGVVILFHRYYKVVNGIDWITIMLIEIALHEFIAYGAFFGEIIAPGMIVVGVLTRFASLAYAVNMLFALF